MSKGELWVVKGLRFLQGTRFDGSENASCFRPQHGFGIARRIEQVSEDVLTLNEGTVYTSLLRLQRGWIAAEWGVSENNRRAKFYSTKSGTKRLAVENGELEAHFRGDRAGASTRWGQVA
jgi:DNA-binding PadR family transcriptional regulator